MSVALPGFVDTGVTLTLSAAATLQMRHLDQAGHKSMEVVWGPDLLGIYKTPDGIPATSCSMDDETPGRHLQWDIFIRVPGTPDVLAESYETTGCELMTSGDYHSHSYAFSGVAGPFRLGVAYTLIDPDQPLPHFAQDYQAEYRWFADASTTYHGSLGGVDTGTRYWITENATPPAADAVLDCGNSVGYMGLQAEMGPGNTGYDNYGEFTGISFNGDGDTSGLVSGICTGDGSKIEVVGLEGTGGGGFYPPLTINYDLDISKFGGSSTGAQIDTLNLGTVTVPHASSHTYRRVSWTPFLGGPEQIAINSAWAAAQPVPYRSDDLRVPLMLAPHARDGSTYSPVTLEVLGALDVLRPADALTAPSAFVSSDGAKITVTDTWSNHFSTFAVSAAGAHVTRTLANGFADRVGLGSGGTANANFGFPSYQYTKHVAGEDIFWWSLYGYLYLDIDAPADGDLTLVLSGNSLEVFDPHTTGSDRLDGYTATQHPWTYTYTIPVTAGRHTYYVDLLLPPGATVPVYPDWVDSIQLSGFRVGTYVLYQLEPVIRGNAHVKIDYGPPVQGGDYSAVVIAADGSFGLGSLPDQAAKADELGQYGGGLRYVTPLVGSSTGEILDAQLSLSDFATHLNNIEGINATYDAAAGMGYLADSYGSRIGELAQFIRPLVPYRTDGTGTPFSPPCSAQCGRIIPAAAVALTVFSRWNAGHGGIETLATSGSRRAPAGQTVIIGGTVSTAVTDAYGWAVWSPLPANGAVPYSDGASAVDLRPHDLIRLLGVAPVRSDGLSTLHDKQGRYYRAVTGADGLRVSRAAQSEPPFSVSALATPEPDDAQPCLYQDLRQRLHLLFRRDPDVLHCTSGDFGRTWSSPTMMFPGAARPIGRFHERSKLVIHSAFRDGSIVGRREDPDGTLGAEFTFALVGGGALVVDDSDYDLSPAPLELHRWILEARQDGNLHAWRSLDNCKHWELIT